MTTFLDEAQVELVVLDILGELGWPRAFGPDIAFDGERPERTNYGDMVLVGRLRETLARINPNVPAEAIEEAVRLYVAETKTKLGHVAQPLRAALTGRAVSPGIFDVFEVLGREESLARLSDQAG